MEKEIKKVLKNQNVKFPLNDRGEIEKIFYYFDTNEVMLNFIVSLVGNNSSDWWLQAEYWSEKIGKTIIWNTDFLDSYEDEKELIDNTIFTNNAIKEFENKLTKLNS